MWDRSGQHVWEFPLFDFQTMRALPEGKFGVDYNKYDFITPWSLSVKMVEPLKIYQIAYDRAGLRLELEFNAVAPPNIMNAPTAEQLKSAFRTHFEQPGRIRGYVGQGEFTKDPLKTFGGAGVVRIGQLQSMLRHICANGFEHHVAANFSTVAGAVQEAAQNYLGWETYHHAA